MSPVNIFGRLVFKKAVTWRCSVAKAFIKIHLTFTETPVSESLGNKLESLRSAAFFKKEIQHRCFTVNFAKFSRTPFLKKHLQACASVFKR